MSTVTPDYDVLLSYSQSDREIAGVVAQKFMDAGLRVFDVYEAVSPTDSVPKAFWQALAEVDSLVVIVTPLSVTSTSRGILIGAAMAWKKPVHVVLSGLSAKDLPSFLRGFKTHHAPAVDKLARFLMKQEGTAGFDETQTETLKQIYSEIGVPVDKMSANTFALAELTADLNERCGTEFSPEEALGGLLNLRKRGGLPRLSKKRLRAM